MPGNTARRLKRREPTRAEGRKVLIVCEGLKTEKIYFGAIRKNLRLSTLQILVHHPGATDPRSIVDFAVKKRREQMDEDRWDIRNDSAWAVYDGIEHYRTSPGNWQRALDTAARQRINLAITNPCFEFYYLLHFQDQNGWLEREAAIRLLKKWIPDYEKANEYYPIPLKERTDAAIQRARSLAALSEANDQKLPHCLCAAGVAELVALLGTL